MHYRNGELPLLIAATALLCHTGFIITMKREKSDY